MPVEPTPASDSDDDQSDDDQSDDDQTQARHVASRAELLPEEQAVGSDDPLAQAEAILAESAERTEHPDADASSQSSPEH